MNSAFSPEATKRNMFQTGLSQRVSGVVREEQLLHSRLYLANQFKEIAQDRFKDNRCILNIKENALKMFRPKNFLLIRKGGKLFKAYWNSTFQLSHKYRFPSHWIYVENIYFIYLKKNYYPIFYRNDYVYLQYISNMEK